ncbi:MAG: short chain dehydrogenase [Labilithrix sp.]|nr:short chain dehydrogenase [Labilithrix sp.]
MTETKKKTALVTGANKGIGFETARQLARLGYVVWLGCRDEGRGVAAAKELAADGEVRFVRLDVTDDASVRAAAERIAGTAGALDVLVNNAAIIAAGDGPPSKASLAALQTTLDVNLVGALRVTQAFLPLVRKAAAGRIVNVSSTMGSISALLDPDSALAPLAAQFPNFAYAASKTALNALTAWLVIELRDTAVKVNALCPGFNATDMNGFTGTQPPSEGAKVVVRAATLGEDGPNGAFLDANGTVGW